MTDFMTFLKTKNDEVRQQEANSRQRVQVWLESLTAFHQQIKAWLKQAIDQGLLKITQDEVFIDELGGYSAPRLSIHIGEEKVVLQPVGTIIIGARGRVDMLANGRSRVLILSDFADKKWSYADHVFSSDVTYRELDAALFTELLQTILS
jgi:hypothetical protein